MGYKRGFRHHRRVLEKCIDNADAICVLGIGLLIAPFFLSKSAGLSPLIPALRNYGWLALLFGSVLIVLGKLLKPQGNYTESVTVWAMPSGLSHTDSPTAATSPSRWSIDVFDGIEWRRFEAVCEALFAQAGFKTTAQSHGAEAGLDVWLFSQHASGPVAVVRCRHRRNKPVEVSELQEFLGVMSSNKMLRGTFATTAIYSSDAQRFAKSRGINALDGVRLLELIASRTPSQQKALLAIAYEGEYWRPTCVRCGIKLVERVPSGGGAPFWGCINYPGCKSLLPMTQGLP